MELPKRETLGIKFKSDTKRLSDEAILDNVVALANTDGGHLYLGIEDDGTPTGVHQSHRDTTRLAAFIANNTVPPVPVRVSTMGSTELLVIDIEVPRSSNVVATTSGKMLRRRLKADDTPESVPLYPYELATRLSALDKLDYSALPATEATLDDIDPNEVVRLRDIVATSHNADKTLLELGDDELLSALRLTTADQGEVVPTVAGLLLVGRKDALARVLPTYGASFQVLEGTEVRVNQDFEGPILQTIQQMDQMLTPWNPEREYLQGLFRSSVPEFDPRAFREAVVNAFGHRDYSRLGRVLVQISDEGMRISNPGGFIEGVTIRNLLTVEPHGRNPRLMAALKRVGLAESTGRGIDRIYEGSLVYGRPLPDWSESNGTSVRLFISRRTPDEDFMAMLEEERQRTGVAPSLRAMLVLDVLKQQRRATVSEIARLANMSDAVTRSVVQSLVEAGLVEGMGEGQNRTYMLDARAYARKGALGEHTLHSDTDHVRHEELVMELARERGQVANRDVASLLHLSEKQAYAVLRGLVRQGRLVLRGRGAGSKYYPVDVA